MQRSCSTHALHMLGLFLQPCYNAHTTPMQRSYDARATLIRRSCRADTTLVQLPHNARAALKQRSYNAHTTLIQRIYYAQSHGTVERAPFFPGLFTLGALLHPKTDSDKNMATQPSVQAQWLRMWQNKSHTKFYYEYGSGPFIVPVMYAPGNNTGTIGARGHYCGHCDAG